MRHIRRQSNTYVGRGHAHWHGLAPKRAVSRHGRYQAWRGEHVDAKENEEEESAQMTPDVDSLGKDKYIESVKDAVQEGTKKSETPADAYYGGVRIMEGRSTSLWIWNMLPRHWLTLTAKNN